MTTFDKLVIIKSNINLVELKLEKFMDMDLADNKVRSEMRTLLNEMSELEYEKSELLAA